MNEKANLTVLVTSHCTLRCKLCATYASTCHNPRHYDIGKMTKSVDRFFDSMEEVRLFTISGGEPFMHPQMAEMIPCFARYIDRIEKFEIITNGTIVPSQRVLEELQFSDKVDIMIDDYGQDISKKVDDIIRLFEQYHIRYRRRKYYGEDAHLGGWLDISDFHDKQRSQAENEAMFKKCMYSSVFGHHFFIIEDTAHMCYVNSKLLEDVKENADEYVNMLEEGLSAKDTRARLLGLRERKQLSMCSRCNGFCNDGKRYAPAEQFE